MTLAFLISILVACISQAVKIISRTLGVTKEIATRITFLVIFLLAVLFTAGQNFQWFSSEQIQFILAILTGAIGNYELFLNKTGLDSVMKDMMELERGSK